MSAHLIDDVVGAAAHARDADGARAFRHAVAAFIRLLASIPDQRAHTLSNDDARVIESLGGDVIDLIEAQVGDSTGGTAAQSLVSSVYEIRRLIEEANRWSRHYATARHP